ncbi:hypothetical protein N0V83_006547 [Neocucurbitaria cava]|uniref:F-box domain-containing protein n=1 Tax=Neocucurbitaria cava TaxID=798079 RepID=A0A9W9CL40_9PLEO|nr:hypothetical protein N0V83_006547 [Neocucurbitaria cava]
MNIFRRSMSSSSSRSRTSTTASTSDSPTPRSSFESTQSNNDISTSLATIKMKKAPPAPLLNLPIELIQQITSYLDNASAASFCLSSRFICYAVGTNHLSSYIGASKSRFEKRRTIEAVVERAFPGHWFCAWCDKFHAWSASDGPKEEASVALTTAGVGTKGANSTGTKKGRRRDCAEFNSYLHDGSDYVLYYHHVRLAINRALWGPAHGIPLAALAHSSSGMTKIFKTPCPTKLQITPVITTITGNPGEHAHQPHLLLHTTYALILPTSFTSNKRLLPSQIWPSLPTSSRATATFPRRQRPHRPHGGHRQRRTQGVDVPAHPDVRAVSHGLERQLCRV